MAREGRGRVFSYEIWQGKNQTWAMGNLYTIWLFNIAMEHDPYIDDVPIFCEKRI